MSQNATDSMKLMDQELNLRNAVAVSETGLKAIRAGTKMIDLSALTAVDSSSVAVMLSWQRAAQMLGQQLQFIGAPASLRSLIDLYGLTAFFQLQDASPSVVRH